MRYRLMATYRGVPYEAGVGPTSGDVVLFAACPPPEELNFEPATGHWRKQVIWAEVDGLWESRPVGIFRGEPCIVLDDLGDRLHIAYLGTDADRAARLDYWQVDRGVFELLAPREEVSSLTEERVDKPLRFASRASSGPAAAGGQNPPARPTYPYGAPGWPSPPPPHPDLPHDRDDAAPLDATGLTSAIGEPLTGSLPLAPLPPEQRPGEPVSPPLAQAGPFPGDFAHVPLPPPGHFPGAGDSVSAVGRPPDGAPEGLPFNGLPFNGVPFPTAGPVPGGPTAQAHAWIPADEDRGRGSDPAGGRSARRQRVTTRDIFCDLADLAAIPRSAYALETEVDGAMCLLPHGEGFEVFVAVDGARHEVRTFAEEEAAYFYLFGVLVAEAIRSGALQPVGTSAHAER